MARRVSSPASPVTITISPRGNRGSGSGSGVTAFRTIGLTSPVPRHSLPTNPNSPITHRRYSTSPRDETDDVASEYAGYTVHIPPTPDRQPSSVSNSASLHPKRSYISGTIFTGGFNSVTRGHVVECSADSDEADKSASVSCRMNGCDEKAMLLKMPCECGFMICKDCYMECAQTREPCPGCKEPYLEANNNEDEEGEEEEELEEKDLRLTSVVEFGAARRRSIVKSTIGGKNGQPVDFDHNRWLFETKGTYGYGNALWPKDGNGGGGVGGAGFKGFEEPPNFVGVSKRPLTRKVGVSQAILSPYR